MTITACYQLATGVITSTLNVGITDAKQIAALEAQGIGILSVPDGTNGGTGMIVDGAYVPFNAPAPPVPDLLVQYIAAQINSGALAQSAFHPTTIAVMNNMLNTAGMAVVTAAVT